MNKEDIDFVNEAICELEAISKRLNDLRTSLALAGDLSFGYIEEATGYISDAICELENSYSEDEV